MSLASRTVVAKCRSEDRRAFILGTRKEKLGNADQGRAGSHKDVLPNQII
jgi:hypothetical protein